MAADSNAERDAVAEDYEAVVPEILTITGCSPAPGQKGALAGS